MYQKGRAWIELNISHLAYNVIQFQSLLPAKCALMPAIKANAYGHGAAIVGKALQNMGVQNFCVATVNEGIELRNAGITGQILVLGYTCPLQFSALAEYSLTQTVVDYSYARELNDYGHPVSVHVGIDTGMHRLGERSSNIKDICKIWEFPYLDITGVFSHLCASDGTSPQEKNFTIKQIKEFNSVVNYLHRRKIRNFKTHLQGSYGVLNYPYLCYDYARLGIALYGVHSDSCRKAACSLPLKPVLSLKARIECVKSLHTGESVGYGLAYTAGREMKLAAVSIGYADGMPRELSNKGYALVKGQKASIIGRICMDQLLIDISNIPDVTAGDEVVFIGKSGKREISADSLADAAGTISNEILSRLGNRLERVITVPAPISLHKLQGVYMEQYYDTFS